MIRTRVGYAGGTRENPTYYSLGDHTECIQVDFDPARLSYAELLDVFWNSHNPAWRAPSRQYKAILFYPDAEQMKIAIESKERLAASGRGPVHTELIPLTTFYLAEDYHQKYCLRRVPELLKDFTAMYPDAFDFTNSPAAARVNGYIGGYGTPAALEAEIDGFGLSPAGRQKLLQIVTG